MQQAQEGFLLIADITGYTVFLRESELEHAKDSLRSLLDLLIEQTKPPLRISRLEGDAVISYALDGSFSTGQTLVDLIEETYIEFRRALDLMVLNTSCDCLACRNIANLDLKFFVHYGTFVLEPLHAYLELIGSDVNILHRLTKNSVTKMTGIRAYVLYTQAAVDQLKIPEMIPELTVHVESFADVGEITTYLMDMHPVWESRKHRYHKEVKPEEAIFIFEQKFNVSPTVAWEYVTNPKYRALIYGSDKQELKDLKKGRISNGSVYICSHGKNIIQQTIVDWHPFKQYTITNNTPGGGTAMNTVRIQTEPDGTRVILLASKIEGGSPIMRGFMNTLGKNKFLSSTKDGFNRLGKLIDDEIETSTPHGEQVGEIPEEQIEEAVVQSLMSAKQGAND